VPKELCFSRVEPIKGMLYIFVTEGELEENLGTLCEEYFEKHKALTIPGQALLVDLRAKSQDLNPFPGPMIR
jgi:hypothetical protein